jgi:hypothetical protein
LENKLVVETDSKFVCSKIRRSSLQKRVAAYMLDLQAPLETLAFKEVGVVARSGNDKRTTKRVGTRCKLKGQSMARQTPVDCIMLLRYIFAMEPNKLRASTPASIPSHAEMDPRGYGLPLHPDYSAYPRVRALDREPNQRTRYEFEREYSMCDLSLSDDQTSDGMPHGTRSPKSPKKHASKSGSGRSSETKHPGMKKPWAASRNQNPGIDTALRSLTHEVNTSTKTFQAFVQCFEADVESLQDWAEDDTLDTVWRNKVKDKCREKRDRERFEGAAGRIVDARAAIKSAVKNAKALKESWHDRYEIERQIRTAKKTLLYCDGIIELAERAASERLACKQLVSELEEVRCLLDRKKHPWICKSTSLNMAGAVLNP